MKYLKSQGTKLMHRSPLHSYSLTIEGQKEKLKYYNLETHFQTILPFPNLYKYQVVLQ